jgi:hypothetical protein
VSGFEIQVATVFAAGSSAAAEHRLYDLTQPAFHAKQRTLYER